jgi:hypothetical protein
MATLVARSPALWRSIPETTLLPAGPEKNLLSTDVLRPAKLRRYRQRLVLGNRVTTIAQVRRDPSESSMCFFSHRLRFKVVGIGVNQYEPRNLVPVQLRKRAHVIAAEGGSHQNVGPTDAGMMKRSA